MEYPTQEQTFKAVDSLAKTIKVLNQLAAYAGHRGDCGVRFKHLGRECTCGYAALAARLEELRNNSRD